ncbi:hypothetical protein [Streptomyces bauhiniae]|uniref:hypothetical protein n=1 Tax=Streptomyces bauhiniae TaxID=2340725 RepID=UPI0035DD8FBC
MIDIDDFAFLGHGDALLAAVSEQNSVALVTSGRQHRTVLTGADGLDNPTSLAVHGNSVLVANGAYFTNYHPNLPSVHRR